MIYEQILHEIQGPVSTITLNRPDKLNAYTNRMGLELADALQQADSDDAVRAIILTGEGRGFCAGADISAGAASFDTSGAASTNFGTGDEPSAGETLIRRLLNCRKVTIAAFNGPAVGVGLTLALPTDIKIAAEDARFGFVFARRGLAPEAGSAWFLPQLVGLPQALRWCLTGNLFTAQEAFNAGLVSEILPSATLMERAGEIALEIAANTAPVSIALTRQLLWRYASADNPFDLLSNEETLTRALGAGEDVKEGVSAFLEKRPPIFPGRVSRDMPVGFPWWPDA